MDIILLLAMIISMLNFIVRWVYEYLIIQKEKIRSKLSIFRFEILKRDTYYNMYWKMTYVVTHKRIYLFLCDRLISNKSDIRSNSSMGTGLHPFTRNRLKTLYSII